MPSYPASSTAIVDTSNLSTIRFVVRQDESLKMPEHSGSMLRGAFGVALRSLTCVTDMPECKDCPLKQHCKFPHIFEMPALQPSTVQAVNPYVIHVPIMEQTPCFSIAQNTKNQTATDKRTQTFEQGDVWQFGMTVMGAAVSETALIIKAWQLALANGLGAHVPYRRATLLQADCDGKILYTSPHLSSTRAIDSPSPDSKDMSISQMLHSHVQSVHMPIQLTMQFLTPFRYQQNNRIVSHADSLDSVTFIASLYNRIRLCQDNHSPNHTWDIGYDSYHHFKEDIETLSIAVNITANHVPRRSNRQQRKMQLYGLQGELHLTGDAQTLTRLLPALQLGEKLHIGKNTTMGLGQYQLRLTSLAHTNQTPFQQ